MSMGVMAKNRMRTYANVQHGHQWPGDFISMPGNSAHVPARQPFGSFFEGAVEAVAMLHLSYQQEEVGKPGSNRVLLRFPDDHSICE